MPNFYYNDNDLSELVIPISLDWTHNPFNYGSSQNAKKLATSPKIGGSTTAKTFVDTIGTANRVLLGQYVSDPLEAGTINLGTIIGYIGAYESNTSMNACPSIIIKLVSNDGQTVRGILRSYLPTSTANEYGTSTTYYSRVHPTSGAATALNVQQGDRVVVEVGTFNNNTVTTSYTCGLYLGSNSSYSDIGTTTTSVGTNTNPYISFSNNITFEIPLLVNITSYSKARISDEEGMTTSTITFQANKNILEWEARADGSGVGQGDLVGKYEKINYAPNPNLNVDSNSDGIADEWEVFYNQTEGSLEIDSTYNCQKLIMTLSTSGTYTNMAIYKLFDNFNVGDILDITLSYKTQGNVGANIWAEFYDATDDWIDGYFPTGYSSNDFTEITANLEIPDGTAYLYIYLVATPTISGGTGTVLFNNISITRSSDFILANTEISFDVDYDELTWGDKGYRINIYVKTDEGWSDYE